MKRMIVSEEYLLNELEDRLRQEGYPECKFLRLPPIPGGVGENECNWSAPFFTCGDNISSGAYMRVRQAVQEAQARYNVDYSTRRRRVR